jgi:regulator of protease activity HflC (stomatin/prohibitin superfamily)
VKVNGATHDVVRDPVQAALSVDDYQYAIAQVSQVTLLTVLPRVDLDSLLREREAIGAARGSSSTPPGRGVSRW